MEKNTPGKYSGTNTHRDNIKGQNNLTFQSKYELIKYLVQRKHTQATEFYLNTTYCLLGLKDNRNFHLPVKSISPDNVIPLFSNTTVLEHQIRTNCKMTNMSEDNSPKMHFFLKCPSIALFSNSCSLYTQDTYNTLVICLLWKKS